MSAKAGGARERMLGTVRARLGASPRDDLRRARVEERLRRHARGTVPSRAEGGPSARQALFTRMATEAAATVVTVANAGAVPAAVADYLKQHNLPASIRMGADPFLAALPWERVPTLERSEGAAAGTDTAGLAVPLAAVAETGTLVLASGPQSPTSINFLPESHIVVVPASRIHGSYEDAFDIVRGAGPGMPRALNLITGPSRTADIEQTLLMGAHGPKRVHIIIVEGA